jgi:hypothetical protein
MEKRHTDATLSWNDICHTEYPEVMTRYEHPGYLTSSRTKNQSALMPRTFELYVVARTTMIHRHLRPKHSKYLYRFTNLDWKRFLEELGMSIWSITSVQIPVPEDAIWWTILKITKPEKHSKKKEWNWSECSQGGRADSIQNFVMRERRRSRFQFYDGRPSPDERDWKTLKHAGRRLPLNNPSQNAYDTLPCCIYLEHKTSIKILL